MKYTHRNRGTCSSTVSFEINDGIINNVSFVGGCNGNLKAIARLVEGCDAKKVADILRGNRCGPRSTSCADQLASAIDDALNSEENINK